MLIKSLSIFILITQAFLIDAQVDNNWFVNQAEAIAYAEKHDGRILMIFAGSDWCRPCIQFKKDVLSNAEFKEYSSDKFSLLYLDFPARKKNKLTSEMTVQNEALAELYNKGGTFPKILLMDKRMVKIRDIPYHGENVKAFSTLLND